MNPALGFGSVMIVFGLLFITVAGLIAYNIDTFEDLTGQQERKDNQVKAIAVGGFLVMSAGAIAIAYVGITQGVGKNALKEGGKKQ